MRTRFIAPADAISHLGKDPASHFSVQNIPFGIMEDEGGFYEVVTRVNDTVIRLSPLVELSQLDADIEEVVGYDRSLLNRGPDVLCRWRQRLFELLTGSERIGGHRSDVLLEVGKVKLVQPLIGAFVDFYSGINHASNVGKMFRPDMEPLLPNYRWLPVGYNGRASSVMPSGSDIRRPKGQTMGKDAAQPVFGPTRELDFELEMGFYVGNPEKRGAPISPDDAEAVMSGLVLVNDWSARDVQRFEYQPLGPFLAKSFATSVSPWIVTLDALEPFRCEGPLQDPKPLPHLRQSGNHHFDIQLEVLLKTAKMEKAERISATNFKELYWSPAQQLAHQTSNGTPIEAGDLYASGTISGTEPGSYGSLLELTWRGQNPITLSSGETRMFLEDGDELILTGYCQGDGYRVGFGEVSGKIVA
jgi:fumarylacetoacetase